MKTKVVLAILGVALITTALVGVSAAQFADAQHQTIAYQTNPNCVNAAAGEQICANNGTCTNTYCNGTCIGTGCNNTYCNQTRAGYCWNSTGTAGESSHDGYGYSYGCGAQEQNQNKYCNQNNNCYTEQNQNQNTYGYGNGMMDQTGYGCGMGHHR